MKPTTTKRATEYVVTSVRFTKQVHTKLAKLAKENSRTISGQLTELIKAAK